MKTLLSVLSLLAFTATAQAGITVLDDTCNVQITGDELSERAEAKVLTILRRKNYNVFFHNGGATQDLLLDVTIERRSYRGSQAEVSLNYQTHDRRLVTVNSNGHREEQDNYTTYGGAAGHHGLIGAYGSISHLDDLRVINRRGNRRQFRALKRAVRALPPCETLDAYSLRR